MIDVIREWTAKDWLEFIGGLIVAMVFLVVLWASLWIGCALDDVCYCENTGDVAVCQSLQ